MFWRRWWSRIIDASVCWPRSSQHITTPITFTIGLIWSRLFMNALKIWDRGKPSSCSRLMILFRMFVMKMIVWQWWGWWWWWRWMKRGLRQLDGCSRLILTDVGQQSATPTQLQRLRLIVVMLFVLACIDCNDVYTDIEYLLNIWVSFCRAGKMAV